MTNRTNDCARGPVVLLAEGDGSGAGNGRPKPPQGAPGAQGPNGAKGANPQVRAAPVIPTAQT